MSDLRRSLDFIESAARAETLEGLDALLKATLADFGVHHYTMMTLADQKNGGRVPTPLSRATPKEWSERYRERGYYNFDPVIHAVINRPSAFTWTELDHRKFSSASETVFNEGCDILKANSSFVVPTHDARGFAGFVSLFFSDREPDEGMRRALKLLAVYALERAKELHGLGAAEAGPETQCPLTPRQREVLSFMALGKTDWEIAAILGIAEKTANQHIEDAKKRINVATRAQAAAVAVHRGWVAL
jgi:LuxR family quorum sensing-dependent transcriptional regulator